MKLTVQAPWAILSIVVFFVAGGLANVICGPNMAAVVALIAAGIVWMVGRDKMQNREAVLEDPPARLFAASDFDVMAAIKDVMENNIGDKWWTKRSFDETADEEGYCHGKYIMQYKEELNSDPPQLLSRQLVLKIKVKKVASQTSVELDYEVASEKIRWTANEILEHTTAMIWQRLEKLEAVKGSKKDEKE